jgi:hypothetical protein
MRTGSLLDRRRASGLSPAQALRLEEHLGGCARCSREAALLDGLRELATSGPESLNPVAREHAIRAALAQAGAAQPAASPFERLWPAGAFAAAALVAAAAAFALVLRVGVSEDATSGPKASAPAVPAALAAARVMSGEIELNGELLSRGAQIAETSSLHSRSGATIALGHAVVELRPDTAGRWSATAHELRLTQGSVVADVDPTARLPFTVATPDFEVQVLGTRFEVSLDEVKVERGRVRVVAADGTVLAETLGAGDHLIVPREDFAGSALDPRPAPRLGAVRARAARSAGTQAAQKGPGGQAPQKDATALLAEARAHLAARRVVEARASIEAALGAAQRQAQRAEAMSLRAECALVTGDLATAVEAYLRVARAFDDDPAGQNALFAAARLEAERGRSAAAAALLERYLARYPHGRFVNEARTRLRELGAVLDHAP